MNSGLIFGLCIYSFVALIMMSIGFVQYNRKDNPVGFYNVVDPPKKEEISDIIAWNKRHGLIWIGYGICIELGLWLGYIAPNEVLEMIFLIGAVIIPLPIMIMCHNKIVKMYQIK